MEFRISDIFDNFLRSYILVPLSILFTLVIGLYYVYGIYEEEYVAQTTVMLGYCKDENEYFDIYLNQSILKNYIELAVSNVALMEVQKDTKLDYTISELRDIVMINYVDGTEYLVIDATTNNKYDSAKISYSVYEVLSREVERVFGLNNIHLVDTTDEGTLKYNKHIFAIIVIIASACISFMASVIKFFLFPNLVYKNKKKKEKIIEKIDNVSERSTVKESKKTTAKKTTVKKTTKKK